MSHHHPNHPSLLANPKHSTSGSVLVIILVTIVFACSLLLLFIEKSTDDLLIAARDADSNRLRSEAYSALETTLAVLEDFRSVNGSLRSPAEGWDDPLTWAAYIPQNEDRTIEITFEDESGKISLPASGNKTFRDLFTSWELADTEIDFLTQALLTWLKPNFEPSNPDIPKPEDYENDPIPFNRPGRPLRNWDELRSIPGIQDRFYDQNGNLNELGQRFVATFSLYEYQKPNINSATPDTLAALGEYDETSRQNLRDFLDGTGAYTAQGPGFFKSANEATQIAQSTSLRNDLGTQIAALWIHVTVTQGKSNFRLSTLIAPKKDGAIIPDYTSKSINTSTLDTIDSSGQSTDPTASKKTANTNKKTTDAQRRSQNKTTADAATDAASKSATDLGTGTSTNLNYPYTILELHENPVAKQTSLIDYTRPPLPPDPYTRNTTTSAPIRP